MNPYIDFIDRILPYERYERYETDNNNNDDDNEISIVRRLNFDDIIVDNSNIDVFIDENKCMLMPITLSDFDYLTEINECCSICYDNYKKQPTLSSLVSDVCKLRCSHYFHIDCINQWINNYHHNCPLCRTELN